MLTLDTRRCVTPSELAGPRRGPSENPLRHAGVWLSLPLLVLASSGRASGQEELRPPEAAGARKASVLLGVGNAMGWLGAQGEWYFRGDRVSVFLGLGYTVAVDEGDPGGASFAAGARVFTSGRTHRGFLEASMSQLAYAYRQVGGVREQTGLYGPGVQVGYHYVRQNGFTALLSVGVGYAFSEYSDLEGPQMMLGFGLGYTWMR